MKKVIIIVIIGTMIALFSIKPIKNTQPEAVIIKQQNIGLPNNAVKRLNEFLNP